MAKQKPSKTTPKAPAKECLYTKGVKSIKEHRLPDTCHLTHGVAHRTIAADINLRTGHNRHNYDAQRPNDKLPVEALNESRKNQLLELNYDSPFRIGLCVYISIPSGASGKWSGIAGVQKLIGVKAMRRLEIEESKRVIECAKKFFSPNGPVKKSSGKHTISEPIFFAFLI